MSQKKEEEPKNNVYDILKLNADHERAANDRAQKEPDKGSFLNVLPEFSGYALFGVFLGLGMAFFFVPEPSSFHYKIAAFLGLVVGVMLFRQRN